eukprot:m.213934 g.213934  ORF g.213934 m.213934 type:complete len:531 (+) comp30691_c0_seq1:172-1764(+)
MEAGVSESAMEAARRGRIKQLEVWEAFMAGQTVRIDEGNGKFYEVTRKNDEETRTRVPVKVDFEPVAVFLDAVARSDEELVTKMLDDGVSANVVNADGFTALHQCSIENNIKIASLLLLRGANVNARDHDLWTPLHAAAACGNWRIANFLLSNGADPLAANSDGDLPLDIVEGDKTSKILSEEIARLNLSEEKLNEIRDGQEKRFIARLAKDIANGQSVEAIITHHGGTALHVAACNEWVEAMEFLFAKHANVHAQDVEGNTPLHLAVFCLNFKAVEILGKHGADPEKRNRHLEQPEVLTEDVTMLRVLKSIKEKRPPSAPPVKGNDTVSRKRMDSSISRRSTASKGSLAKMDMQKEHKNIESKYARLTFDEDKEPKEKPKEKEKAAAAPAAKQQEAPKPKPVETIYSQIDMSKKAPATPTTSAENANAAASLASPSPTTTTQPAATPLRAKDIPTEGTDQVKPQHPKMMTKTKTEMRKPSLAAIALGDGLNEDGEDAAAAASSAAASKPSGGAAAKSGGGGGGGCCTVS